MIRREERGSVAILRMEQGQGNLVNIDLVDALSQSLNEVARSSAGALVLTGNNSTFIDGGDLFAIVEGGPPYIRIFISKFAKLLKQIFTLPLPIVAAVNGSAMTSGYTVAAACDLRVMTTNSKARIAVQALNFAVPLEPTPLEMVRYVVSTHHIQNLMFTGREVGPTEAHEMGLVDELASPDSVLRRALELADHLSKVPNVSFVQTKQQLRKATLERISQYEEEYHSNVSRIWTDDKTLAVWSAIVEQLKRQSAR